jgi:hypothetical protein
MTKQRKLILAIINESEGHLTAEEIFIEAKKRIDSIAFAMQSFPSVLTAPHPFKHRNIYDFSLVNLIPNTTVSSRYGVIKAYNMVFELLYK